MKNIEFIFLLFFMLSACNWGSNCNKIEISDELGEWLKCYNEGDTIILKSNMNNYDSLVVKPLDSLFTPCNKFELGPNQYQSKSLSLRSISKEVDTCRNQLIKSRIGLTLSSRRNYNKEFKAVSVYNLHFSNSACEREKIDSILNCENLVWVKVPYFRDSIYSFKFDERNSRFFYNNVNSEYPCAVKSFHWSKEHGLVQYETEDEEVYRLIKK